ncbi:MAG: hypothetical protein JST02_13730, partial [Bacteroidetes bacterium]|nr:hypothetical protein [Bacteroidota bacterium]
HLAREQVKQKETGAIENSLNIIQSNAGEMVNKLNDIVWLINPGQDSLRQLMERLEDYAMQLAVIKNIHVLSGFSEQLGNTILPTETRRSIYLLFKEAINNAVKYSNASFVELKVEQSPALVTITLKDNGEGFDVAEVKRGNGLNNMEQRARDLNAAIAIQSVKGAGTSVKLTVKIP